MRTTSRIIRVTLPLLLCCFYCRTQAAPRDIQFRSVDFDTQVLELFNFGATSQSLSGWRFCSHDENQSFRYSTTTGLNGQSINPGESLFIHFAGDATQPNELNVSQLGDPRFFFATPLDQGPAYSIGLYVSSAFAVGSQLADHIQWSINGAHNATASSRSSVAVSGGVWTAATAWIPVTATTKRIELADLTGGILHGPANYNIIEESIPGDISGNGSVGPEDFDLWKANFGTADVSADLNQDGTVNAADYTLWRNNVSGALGSAGEAAAVPEPATLVVLMVVTSFLGASRRERDLRFHRH